MGAALTVTRNSKFSLVRSSLVNNTRLRERVAAGCADCWILSSQIYLGGGEMAFNFFGVPQSSLAEPLCEFISVAVVHRCEGAFMEGDHGAPALTSTDGVLPRVISSEPVWSSARGVLDSTRYVFHAFRVSLVGCDESQAPVTVGVPSTLFASCAGGTYESLDGETRPTCGSGAQCTDRPLVPTVGMVPGMQTSPFCSCVGSIDRPTAGVTTYPVPPSLTSTAPTLVPYVEGCLTPTQPAEVNVVTKACVLSHSSPLDASAQHRPPTL